MAKFIHRPPTGSQNLTSDTKSDSANSLAQEWWRVNEACGYMRCTKPVLYRLLNAGLVKSVSLKQRGQTKGLRLVSVDSLKSFLNSRATGGDTE